MKSGNEPKLTVLEFTHCINQRDIAGLSELVAEEYTFIDSSDDVHIGKENMITGWTNFFDSYPYYQNHFMLIESRGNEVFVLGHSTCEIEPLNGPVIRTALAENDLVAEWRVYLETDQNRAKLGMSSSNV